MIRFLVFGFLLFAVLAWLRPPAWLERGAFGRWFRTILVSALALLYVGSPIDLIPDGVPIVGRGDDIAVLIATVLWIRRVFQEAEEELTAPPPPRTEPASWDPHAVLGVAQGATREEIRQAYLTRMKEYHPDRVADLGPDLQKVAHEKTLQIQRAYEELGR